VDAPYTRTERRKLTVNLLIRVAVVGVLTWRIAVDAGHSSVWETAIYAVLDFLIFTWAVALFWAAVYGYRRTP